MFFREAFSLWSISRSVIRRKPWLIFPRTRSRHKHHHRRSPIFRPLQQLHQDSLTTQPPSLAYITVIPAIIFLILEPYNRIPLVRFHSLPVHRPLHRGILLNVVLRIGRDILHIISLIGFCFYPVLGVRVGTLYRVARRHPESAQRRVVQASFIGDIAEKTSPRLAPNALGRWLVHQPGLIVRFSRRCIISTAAALSSTITNPRPCFAAASPVVPLPAKKSSTVSPAFECTCTIRSRIPSGFCVAYPVFSFL